MNVRRSWEPAGRATPGPADGNASMDFTRTEVDGVPVFWTESGSELVAGLTFRVGRADESLARAGTTHLIEHLVLYPLGVDARLHHNGQVDAATTTFVTRGGPGEVADFFRAVCANLRDLPAGRLGDEKQVLRTEADGRRPAMTDPLFVARYGAETYGLVALPELGLAATTAEDLRAWADRYFTRGNAALWIAGGPPPDDLRLNLPDGAAVPAPRPTGIKPSTPGYLNAALGGVSWCGLVRRSTRAQVYTTVLGRRLRHELRYQQAVAYSPIVTYAIRDREMAHVLAVADGLPEVHSRLVAAFIREVEKLEESPVTEDELRSAADSMRAEWETPRGAVQHVITAARNAIMDRQTPSIASSKERLAAVTPADVQEVGKEALNNSVFALPRNTTPNRWRFSRIHEDTDPVVAGRQIRSADHPLDRSHLVVGPEGVSLIRGQATGTVRYADCAALLKWPDGARELVGRDALTIRIEPTLWRLKKHAGTIDSMAPAGRSVTMPYRPKEQIPRPWTRRRTRVAGRLLFEPIVAVLVGVVPVVTALILLAKLAPRTAGITAAVLVPALLIGINAGRTARARLLIRAAEQNAKKQH